MRRALLLLLVAACAHVPEELTAARKDYVSAQAGADLAEARAALDLATREFERNGDSERARELATIARLRIDTANSKARMANDQAYLAALTAEAARLKEAQTRERAEIEAQAAALPPVPKVTELPPELPVAMAPDVPVPAETPPVPGTEEPPSPVLESLTFAKVTTDALGTVITVPAALIFTAGKSGLSPEAKARLDEIATGLRDRQEKISVEVHTDSTGTHVANQQLSAKRAREVKDYLIGKGVPAGRIESHGLGDTRPVVENDTAKNRALNRRLEIILKPVPVSWAK